MNYTFTDPNQAWLNRQQVFNNQIPLDFSGQPISPQTLIDNKEECQLMENQLFNEFSAGIKKEDIPVPDLSNSVHYDGNSGSSDNSSPSTLLNNVPISHHEVDSLNSHIQNNTGNGLDDKNLSEEELTKRRKAQNRAAQRAFRERKETKLKELREQLDQSESDKAELLKQLEELKKHNIVISTENKLLLENSNNDSSAQKIGLGNDLVVSKGSSFSFPEHQQQQAPQIHYYTSSNQLTDPNIAYEFKRLTIPEVWEYLSEKNETLDFEINKIMEEVKGLEVCHERGPAYPLPVIDRILQQHVSQQS